MRTWGLVGACLWLAFHALDAGAATYRVGIGDVCGVLPPGQPACFMPAELAIDVGDTVEFYQYADTIFTGFHNVVADDGSFRCARGCDGEGGDGTPVSDSSCDAAHYSCVWNAVRLSFVRTFSQPGAIRYHDEVSKAAGVIVVKDPTSRLDVSEIYSNADGSVQFMVFSSNGDPSTLVGRRLVATSSSGQHMFTFPAVAPDHPLGGRLGLVLVATQGIAILNLVRPDCIVPNGFFFISGGAVSLRDPPYQQDARTVYRYASLPVDGSNALYPSIDYDIGLITFDAATAVAVNHAANYAALAPLATRGVVEYYNSTLDDYFLTADDAEIAALDSGKIAGWLRTGYGFATWDGPSTHVIPGLDTVCREFLGVTHFFS